VRARVRGNAYYVVHVLLKLYVHGCVNVYKMRDVSICMCHIACMGISAFGFNFCTYMYSRVHENVVAWNADM
jgi:hypothetical protein